MSPDALADSTVGVRVGSELVGSGFRFVRPDVVVTNLHVLPPTLDEVPISATDPSGSETELELLRVSQDPHRDGYDYAILEAVEGFDTRSPALQPAEHAPSRGDTVWFAGHPFETTEPLVHRATVSGPHSRGFYFNGSVNLGNSGGPIVSAESGNVVGIVTESEMYRSESLTESIDALYTIQQQLSQIQEVHETTINRVEVESLVMTTLQEVHDAIDLLSDNVSSGIGVGYDIDPVRDCMDELDM